MLTPVDIETVEFKKVALGYSPDEVNSFLDKVIVEFEYLYKENIKLNDKVNVLNDGIQYYKSLEDTLKNSIILAEKTASETKYNANQSSEHIIKEAQLKATEILQDANKKLYDLEYEVMKMKRQYNNIKTKLRALLNTEIEILNESEKDFYESLEENEYEYENEEND